MSGPLKRSNSVFREPTREGEWGPVTPSHREFLKNLWIGNLTGKVAGKGGAHTGFLEDKEAIKVKDTTAKLSWRPGHA